MDLGYLRAHPEHLPAFLLHQRIRETPVSGGQICNAQRLTLDDGASVFAKTLKDAPAGFFAAEAAGLRWLRETQTVGVPEVIAESDGMLALEWIEPGEPNRVAAQCFGRELAAMHAASAPRFGAPWRGYVGSLPLDNTESDGPWPAWFAQYRLEPYLRASVDDGALSAADAAVVGKVIDRVDELAGAAAGERPSRVHGDLWPGNLVWTDERVWLVDPAAHGGHRETDLAVLALFGGPPHLDSVLAAYDEAFPLAEGWRERVPLHQLYLLLAHTAIFGMAYRGAVLAAATALA